MSPLKVTVLFSVFAVLLGGAVWVLDSTHDKRVEKCSTLCGDEYEIKKGWGYTCYCVVDNKLELRSFLK